MTTFTRVVDDSSDNLASYHNELIDGLQALMMPDGWATNYTISVTVSSNNITVALKTKEGTDPSSTDPVTAWIAGTKRQSTAALSVTKNAGTNWFNSGSATGATSAGLATKEIDYFVYLIWNTTPGTDIMDIGFARFPNARVYSDFSGTTTNEKYLAFGNASTPTSTDNVIVIGRFAATLSATASFNWSVPTFTNSNLIQHPIYETRWLSYAPTYTPNGSMTYGTVTSDENIYRFDGNALQIECGTSAGTVGGTPSTTISVNLPFTPAFAATIMPGWGWVNTNSAYGVGFVYFTTTQMNFRLYNSGNWTAGTSFFGGSGLLKY